MRLNDFKYAKYPNPRFRRENFTLLNGKWNFTFLDEFKLSGKYNRKILVPFAYECKKSGINEKEMHNYCAYRTTFKIKELGDYILHFESVDYKCEVYVNKKLVMQHVGCYTAFSAHLNEELVLGTNVLEVLVYDSYDTYQLRGKQRTRGENYACWYTQYTGIIKDVYLEKCGKNPVQLALFKANDEGKVDYKITLKNKGNVSFKISFKGETIKEIELNENKESYDGSLIIENPSLYSEENTALYDVEITSGDDKVSTYFGFRSLHSKDAKLFINDKNLYLRMILNQGYYYNKLITPEPKDILNDLLYIKEVGFNGIRIHQKQESNLFYYLCDELGIYLWSEIPSAYEFSEEMNQEFERELARIILQNYNSPSIILYLLFNESWGVSEIKDNKEVQGFINKMGDLTRKLDDSRYVILNDGWFNMSGSDLSSLHDYEQEASKLAEFYVDKDAVLSTKIVNNQGLAFASGNEYKNQPVIISEFGGHSLKSSSGWGYGEKRYDKDTYRKQFNDIFNAVRSIKYASGYCYTQLSDVEQETNGMMYENRKSKLPVKEFRKMILGDENE